MEMNEIKEYNPVSKKICFLGDTGVGKTTFLKLILTGIYEEKVSDWE